MTFDVSDSQLIKQVYSAGNDPQAWDAIASDLFQLMGCHAGLATLIDLPRSDLVSCRVYGPSSSSLAKAIEEYPSRFCDDPVLRWASAHPDARFSDSRQTLPKGEYLLDPFVQWTGDNFGSTHWYLALTASTEELTFTLAAHFANPQDDETGGAMNRFRMIFDHIECAMRIGKRPFGVDSARFLIRVDREGNIQGLSKAAEILLHRRPALHVSDGRLIISSAADQARLDDAIERAFGGALFKANPTAVHITQEGCRPWIIVVRPVAENYGPFGQVRRQVELEILDGIPAIGRLNLIQSLFNLTARELQVLRLLADGHSIDSLSETITVSRNTTRGHLHSIFSKTRTNSQSELMQLCAGLTQASAVEQPEFA